MNVELRILAVRLFEAWADAQRLTTFGRSRLKRAWLAAFEAGLCVGAELASPAPSVGGVEVR